MVVSGPRFNVVCKFQATKPGTEMLLVAKATQTSFL